MPTFHCGLLICQLALIDLPYSVELECLQDFENQRPVMERRTYVSIIIKSKVLLVLILALRIGL